LNLWLLDASVVLASEDVDDEHHHDARRLLSGTDPLATLDLAFYEVANVAVRSWRDRSAGARLRQRLRAIADDGGLVRADEELLTDACALADKHGISVYDAAYVAAARRAEAQLVSCDVQDLVSRELARLPADA
jgi:predicted nucleic acid-binding protein